MGACTWPRQLVRCEIAGIDILLSEYAGLLLAVCHGIKQMIRPGSDPGAGEKLATPDVANRHGCIPVCVAIPLPPLGRSAPTWR